MSDDKQLIRQYFEGWKHNQFQPDLFAEDFKFRGPLAQANSRKEYFELLKEMEEFIDIKEIEIQALFTDGLGNGCAIYELTTTKPDYMTTECSEFFQFKNGKIQEIRLIYDARAWESFFQLKGV